jgi:TRAP-type C4-dicarboxylate transport system permease small subunit
VLGKTKLKFKGGTLDSGLNVITSSFNASTILAMHVKALKQTGLNWSEIFKYAALVLQIVVLPVALTTCSISIYAIIKAIRRRRKKNKRARIDKKYALRRNFELNKKVARKVRRMEP